MWIFYTLKSQFTCLAPFCFIQLHIIVVFVVINTDLFSTLAILLTRCVAGQSVKKTRPTPLSRVRDVQINLK